MNALTVYFCNISGKWHLDECFYKQYKSETGGEAKVAGKWLKKVKIMYRTVLGDNIKTFKSQYDAQYWSIRMLGKSASPYEPLWTNNATEWVVK